MTKIKNGFNSKRYFDLQAAEILARVEKFGQLYLEVGGKLIDDLHAQRVLPGFDASSKIKVLSSLKDRLEVIVCVSAVDLERNKIRSDNHMSYADESIRLIKFLREHDILVNNVVVTLFNEQKRVMPFTKKLAKMKLKVHFHAKTAGYPTDVDTIVSEAGYGQNSFIQTERNIVVVTAPGPSSGKMATCLSQIYHESLRGRTVGYAKFETFPVWNLPINHPVNVAYEAATLDLLDTNMIDPYHLANYGVTAVNYNRDIETFPVLKRIFDRIYGREIYKSPTDMGVNVIAQAIIDDQVVCEAAKQEIIRRYFATLLENQLGEISDQALERAKLLMENVNVTPLDRKVVKQAIARLKQLDKNLNNGNQVSAIQLVNGSIVTGKKTAVLSSVAAAMLNILKLMAGIDDSIYLLPPEILEPINDMKCNKLGMCHSELSLEEVLLALVISAVTNPMAKMVVGQLDKLRGAQLHSTALLSDRDRIVCRHLGIDVTVGLIENN